MTVRAGLHRHLAIWPQVGLFMTLTLGGCADDYLSRQPLLDAKTARKLTDLEPVGLEQLIERPRPELEGSSSGETIESMLRPVASREVLDVSLNDVRTAVLSHNLGLVVDRINPAIAHSKVMAESGKFDAVFSIEGGKSVEVQPGSEFDHPDLIYNNDQTQFKVGLDIPLLTGGTLDISTDVYRYETFLNNPNGVSGSSDPSIAYPATIRASLRQPLLRGAGVDVALGPMMIAAYEQREELASLRLNVITALVNAEQAYWTLYLEWRALEIAQSQYTSALEQVVDAEAAVLAGIGSEVGVYRATLSAAEQMQSLIAANTRLKIAERALKIIMNRPDFRLDAEQVLHTSITPVTMGFEFDAKRLTQVAISHRAELLASEYEIAAAGVNMAIARNQLLPELDFHAGLEYLGIDATSPTNAYKNLFAGQAPVGWSVGGSFSMPLGNRQAEGAYRQAVMQRLRAIGSRRDRELTIAQEVYNAVDHLEGSWLVMTAAAEAKFESEKSFDAARELFKRGMQSSLDVAVALDNLGTARLSHLRATVDYQMQLVRLAAATGTVLGRANIEIDPFDPGTDESLEGTLRAAERSTTSPLIQPPAATLPAPLTPTDPK